MRRALSGLLCDPLASKSSPSRWPGQFTAESGESLGYPSFGVIKLFYESGTLVAAGASRADLPDAFVWDGRTRQWRAPASAYRDTILRLRESEIPHEDLAASFERPSLESRVALAPRPLTHLATLDQPSPAIHGNPLSSSV